MTFHTRSPLSSFDRNISNRPYSYISVVYVAVIKDPPFPEIPQLDKPYYTVDDEAESQWCQHIFDIISMSQDLDSYSIESNQSDGEHASWAAYHACHQAQTTIQLAISILLPLFLDDFKSVELI